MFTTELKHEGQLNSVNALNCLGAGLGTLSAYHRQEPLGIPGKVTFDFRGWTGLGAIPLRLAEQDDPIGVGAFCAVVHAPAVCGLGEHLIVDQHHQRLEAGLRGCGHDEGFQ